MNRRSRRDVMPLKRATMLFKTLFLLVSSQMQPPAISCLRPPSCTSPLITCRYNLYDVWSNFNIFLSLNFIFYLQYLAQQRRKQEEERNALRKEVMALRIMQTNYENMVRAHQSQPGPTETRVSDETKFQVVKH